MSSRSRQILFIVKTQEYGGAEKHLQELIRRMEEPDTHITILCYGADFYSEIFKSQCNVRVIPRNGEEPKTFVAYWATLVRMHVDTVVLVKGWSEEFALHTYIAIKAAGAKRLVALEHLTPEPPPALARVDGFLGSLRGLLGWRNRFMLKKRLQGMLCSTTICVSEGIRARLVHEYAYADAKTVVIRNGVDLKRFTAPHPERRNEIRTSFGVKNEEIVLLCTSRLAARKRLDVLLQGLKSIPVNRFAWQCWIVGSGPVESDLRVLASSLGLQRRVKFFGFQGDTVPFLNAADIYVTTSEKEGFPLSLVEAMGCKLPCIATNIPGHDEIVQHGSNGFLIPPGSPQHLADAVISLAQSSDLRHRMGEAARKWVEQHCDIEECMARIRSVVQA